ncbi:GntR family transcriptional regulator [Alteromonas sp. CI.11.F.A3]|uniref:GntR family transcriptional regulator n=1 Tax=unclassified Alteromonas TaxID=2614992 RepID=UPI001B39DDB4|nr:MULTISPECIES: GntR family transcriptional regulator [unclassified Alteromonas]MBQ4829092.1 GntR family transcriptional regulator [Alteromonas sp. MMG017]WOI37862.1 GntR family transcriptional regulator [Alteromonas sp. CI.11.F.A3]
MSSSQFDHKLSGPSLAFQPLYQQVAEYIKQLIVERRWQPGEMLPSEFKLADEFNVSQGTVRKALTLLTDTKIVTRRQGVGTFVSEHTAQDALFRFFPLQADGKGADLPKAELLGIELISPDKNVQAALNLSGKERVTKLERRRILDNEFCMLETIFLPAKYFVGIHERKDIPHTLYHFYQTDFNQTVFKTRDGIKAVLASDNDAKLLQIKAGEPLLLVTRVTESIDGKLIEYRESKCRSDHYHYQVELD